MFMFTSPEIQREVCVHAMWAHSAESVVSVLERGGEVAQESQLRHVEDGEKFKVFNQADKLESRCIIHAYINP